MENTMSRVKRSKAKARASYDRLSRWYDILSAASEKPFIAMGVNALGE